MPRYHIAETAISERAPRVPNVLQLVALEVLLGGEALAAGGATEGAFPSVSQHVALNVGWVIGRVGAQAARVLLSQGASNGPLG